MVKNKITKSAKKILKITIAILIGLPIYHIARIFDLRIVFLFHQISNNPDYFSESENLNIKPYKFKRIIKNLIKHFEVVDDYIFFNQNVKKFRNKPLILITFDDGYFDAIEESHKISQKYNLPIIHFINTEYIEYSKLFSKKFSPAKKYYKYIDIFQTNKKFNLLEIESKYPKRSSINFLKSLNNNKLIYCSHGHNHINYFDPENSNQILKDFNKSKKIIEHNKFNADYFAFPFGRVDSKILNLLKKITLNKVYFFLGIGALNNINVMKNKRLVRRVSITSDDISFIMILYRISISLMISIIKKFKNLFSSVKIYH